MKRFPEIQSNKKITRSRDVSALSRLALLLFSGLVLAGGFVFAGKNHFAAVQYGYKSESLRRERSQLLQQNQQLSLEKQRISSPATLEKAAASLGLKPATAAQIGVQTSKPSEKAKGEKENDKTKASSTR
ncbi:MAG TPA: hypothetical protein VLA93_15785 [Pyrinomonadaceae bacterium]|nr:hypothetical protein [Pyrinomonadaceae bacterium]